MSEQSLKTTRPLTVAYLTSGAAGMFCGSCLHDNSLARALIKLGVDAQLIPTYTPIRTDEQDVSIDRVFFGGITVFLQQKMPLFRRLPNFVTRWLDQPWLIRLATSRGVQPDYKDLGALTVSMLEGQQGFQRSEVQKLCDWLGGSLKPDVVNFSNILIGGCIPALKERLRVPVVVTLQGDDIFLQSLPEPYLSRAVAEIRRLVKHVDAFVVNSHFYGQFMGEWFQIPPDKLHVIPLAIDLSDFKKTSPAATAANPAASKRLGYLARLAPEKGLHLLVDAFIALRQRPEFRNVELHIAGWLGESNRKFADEQFAKLRAAGLGDAFHYAGAVDRQGKVEFLRSLDLFSVPTTYHEPKGLFVLEALAAGVPVVQPNHGAFAEVLQRYGGGQLFASGDVKDLTNRLAWLLSHDDERQQLGRAGQEQLRELGGIELAAQTTKALFEHLRVTTGAGG